MFDKESLCPFIHSTVPYYYFYYLGCWSKGSYSEFRSAWSHRRLVRSACSPMLGCVGESNPEPQSGLSSRYGGRTHWFSYRLSCTTPARNTSERWPNTALLNVVFSSNRFHGSRICSHSTLKLVEGLTVLGWNQSIKIKLVADKMCLD